MVAGQFKQFADGCSLLVERTDSGGCEMVLDWVYGLVVLLSLNSSYSSSASSSSSSST